MAGSPRTGNSSFWTSVTDLSLAAQATALDLYTNGINRISDRTIWLRDAITGVRSDLAQTAAGTKATVIGTIDLSSTTYDSVTGTLNGLIFQSQADTGGVKTTTFGTGGSAPMSPAEVVAQVAAAVGGAQSISVDSAGHLNVASATTGSGSTINIVGGSAVTALGYSVAQNATGVSSGNDGISRVSGASVVGSSMTLPAGSLRAMLQYLADHVPSVGSLVRRCQPSPGDTISGTVNASPNGQRLFATTGAEFHIPIVFPERANGKLLTALSVNIKGSAGHSAFPGGAPTMPTIQLTVVNDTTTAVTAVGPTSDTTSTAAAYEALHAVALTGLGGGLTIDVVNNRYLLVVVGEAGGAFLANDQLWSYDLTVSY